tara:strand:+ start:803 stop:2179 length:1377 start_codon:yes stop_codon:yes gene_type:complete
MTKNKKNLSKTVSGWGCNSKALVKIINPKDKEELQEIISNSKKNSLISRGLGRSYGDAAQLNNRTVINLNCFQHIYLNKEQGIVNAGGGVSFDNLLKKIIPQGFFLPVSPGTRNVTVGGAIAADVHGKNHHINGSFGNHIIDLLIIDGLGQIKSLNPRKEAKKSEKDKFWATIGGMGLTGVIIEATFSLIPIKTAKISVDTTRHRDIDSLMEKMVICDNKFQYSVAWLDTLNKSGRGILTCGNHATPEQIKKEANIDNLLEYNPKSIATAPSFIPNGLLNRLTVNAFNEAYFRKAPESRTQELQDIASFFHPLDGIQNWNRVYGPKGFLQYQFVVPDSSAHLIKESIEIFRKIGIPSFLSVLKRFGEENSAFLSFPKKGWTLAVDIPLSIPKLERTLFELDIKIAEAGGRIYLAKDSRQSSDIFSLTYPKLNEWKTIQTSMDPNRVFCSDLALRLNLV